MISALGAKKMGGFHVLRVEGSKLSFLIIGGDLYIFCYSLPIRCSPFLLQPKVLDLVVYDHDFAGKDDFMGRAAIDLTSFEPERTHNVEQV